MPRAPITIAAEEVVARNAKYEAARARPCFGIEDGLTKTHRDGKTVYKTPEGKIIVPLPASDRNINPPPSPVKSPQATAAKRKLEPA